MCFSSFENSEQLRDQALSSVRHALGGEVEFDNGLIEESLAGEDVVLSVEAFDNASGLDLSVVARFAVTSLVSQACDREFGRTESAVNLISLVCA